jgi:hypothetical protein
MLIGVLQKGSTINVSYTSEVSSQGLTTLMIGTVPPEACTPSGSKTLFIAPAANETYTIKLNDNTQMVRVFVTMPKDGGSGNLVVTENTDIKNSETITSNTNWDYSVE